MATLFESQAELFNNFLLGVWVSEKLTHASKEGCDGSRHVSGSLTVLVCKMEPTVPTQGGGGRGTTGQNLDNAHF